MTDHAIRTALGLQVSQLAGSRILRLFPLDKGQRRELAVTAFGRDERKADGGTLFEQPELSDRLTAMSGSRRIAALS